MRKRRREGYLSVVPEYWEQCRVCGKYLKRGGRWGKVFYTVCDDCRKELPGGDTQGDGLGAAQLEGAK